MRTRIFCVPVVFLSLVGTFCQVVSAKDVQEKVTGDKLEFALGMYEVDCHELPLTKDGLAALTKKPEGKCPDWGPDPYIASVPRDAWGNEWLYSSDGKTFTLKSLGKDRKPGGVGADADLIFNKVYGTKSKKSQ